jgi:hypothetical protein
MSSVSIQLVAIDEEEERRRKTRQAVLPLILVALGTLVLTRLADSASPAAKPQLVTVAEYDFGTCVAGSAAAQTIVAGNQGDAPFEAAGVAIEGLSTSDFAIDGSDCQRVESHSTCRPRLLFAPRSAGEMTTTVRLLGADGTSSSSIRLRGVGIVPGKPADAPTPPAVIPTATTPVPVVPKPRPLPPEPPPTPPAKPIVPQPKPDPPKPDVPSQPSVTLPVEKPVADPAMSAPPTTKPEPPVAPPTPDAPPPKKPSKISKWLPAAIVLAAAAGVAINEHTKGKDNNKGNGDALRPLQYDVNFSRGQGTGFIYVSNPNPTPVTVDVQPNPQLRIDRGCDRQLAGNASCTLGVSLMKYTSDVSTQLVIRSSAGELRVPIP